MDADLAMFTNAQFLDFDGMNGDLQSSGFGAEGQGAAPEGADMKSLDFDLSGTTLILFTSYTPFMLLFICSTLPLGERQVVISSGSSTTQPRCIFNAYQDTRTAFSATPRAWHVYPPRILVQHPHCSSQQLSSNSARIRNHASRASSLPNDGDMSRVGPPRLTAFTLPTKPDKVVCTRRLVRWYPRFPCAATAVSLCNITPEVKKQLC